MPLVVRIIVYPIFAVASFLVFFLFMFPFDSIKVRVETEAERGLGGQYDIQIGEMSLAPITGLSLKEVVLKEKRPQGATLLKVDGAKVHFELFPLLWGSTRLGFDLKTSGSRVYGRLAQTDEQVYVEADISNLDISHFPVLQAKWGLDLASEIDGKIDVELYPEAPLRNNGSIQLSIDSLKIAKSNIKGLFPLPAMTFATPQGKSKVDLVMNRGSMEIRVLNLSGGDLQLQLGGKVYLAQRVDNFRFNIRGKLGVGEKVGEELPFLAIIKKQKDPEGLYPFTVTGQVRKPNIRIGDFRIPI